MDANREVILANQNDEGVHKCQKCMASDQIEAKLATLQKLMISSGPPVRTHEGPFQLCQTLWDPILTLAPHRMSSIVVVPSLDSRTLYRVAVTVNAALIRLDIADWYHSSLYTVQTSEDNEFTTKKSTSSVSYDSIGIDTNHHRY